MKETEVKKVESQKEKCVICGKETVNGRIEITKTGDEKITNYSEIMYTIYKKYIGFCKWYKH